MDGNRFDSFSKSFAERRTRRGALSLALAGMAALLPSASRAAQRLRDNGVVCGKNADCLSGYCAPKIATGRRLCAPPDPCAGITGPEGSMSCAGQTGFCTIDHGVGVFRNCASGTVCRATNPGVILCDWPN
jgi:hypothetical protein